MKLNRIILFICLIFVYNTVFAQDRVVRGHIVDADSREALIGVSIAELDNDNRIIGGGITDVNGNFQLLIVSSDHALVFSSIGYKTQRFKIGDRTIFDLAMEPDNIVMEEVVVTAVRDNSSLTNIPLVDLAGSVTEVNMADISEVGISSAADALQGKIGGVDITSAGTPGSGSQIIIRGLSSLSGSNPLIVVDGLAQDVKVNNNIDFGSADAEDIGDMVSVAPQDIASIRVLKDASATAQWGARGAAGVIEITTRRGRTGRTTFSYNFSMSQYFDPSPIPMLNGDEYVTLMIDELKNADGVIELTTEYPQIANDPLDPLYYNYNKNTDWVDAITQVGNRYEHHFSASGGGERARYNISVGKDSETGTTKGTGYDKLTTRINVDYQISSKLTLKTSLSYTESKKNDNYMDKSSGSPFKKNIRDMAYKLSPNRSIYEYDSTGNLTGRFFTPIDNLQVTNNEIDYYNPVALIANSYSKYSRDDLNAQAVLRYKINSYVYVEQIFGYQYRGEVLKSFLSRESVATPWISEWNDKLSETNTWSLKRLSRSTLNMQKAFGIHKITGSFLWEIVSRNELQSSTQKSNGLGSRIQETSALSVINDLGSSEAQNHGASGLATFTYTLANKYVFQGGARLEGSGKFGSNNRWGLFPVIGFTYHMQREKFIGALPWISNSRIHFSYGIAGNEPSNAYAQYSIYKTPERNTYAGNRIIIPDSPELRNLMWERSHSLTAGWDLGFLDDRISVILDFYRTRTNDILSKNYDIPLSTGYEVLQFFNGATIENKGWEFTLNGRIKNEGKFKIDGSFNINRNINTFLKFADNYEQERNTSINNGVYPFRLQLNQPVGSFYGFIYEGVYQTDDDAYARDENGKTIYDLNGQPVTMRYKNNNYFGAGDSKYKDINYDGNIDIYDVVYLGNMLPEYTGNLGARFRYENLSLSLNFLYRVNFKIINQLGLELETMNSFDNQSMATLSRWRDESIVIENQIHRAEFQNKYNSLGSSYYVEDGDYLRLNSASLSYSMPKELIRRLHMSNMKLTLSGRKLITFTNYSGVDPEIRVKAPDKLTTDNARTPVPRYITLDVQVGF